jgi:hypothetical protein
LIIYAADYFAGTEMESAPLLRYASVRWEDDNHCKIRAGRSGPVFDVIWLKDLRRIGVGLDHVAGRRFCFYEYHTCDQFNRHTPNGVIVLTPVGCRGPRP